MNAKGVRGMYERERIETEIDAINISAEILLRLVSKRVGEILRADREHLGDSHKVPSLRGATSSKRKAVAKTQVAEYSSNDESVSKARSKANNTARWKGHKRLTPSAKAAKQKIYIARHEAKKKGIPKSEWPPLPTAMKQGVQVQ